MAETLIVLSSDSDGCTGEEDAIKNIVDKYIHENCSPSPSQDSNSHSKYAERRPKATTRKSNYSLSSSDDESGKATTNIFNSYKGKKVVDKPSNFHTDGFVTLDINFDRSPTKPLTIKERRQLDKEAKKKEKEEQKMQKQKEIDREKALKQVLTAQRKKLKPEECIKFITAHLDQDLVIEDYGKGITTALDLAGVTYRLTQQVSPGVVTWTRQQQSHSISDDGNLASFAQDISTDEALIIMNYTDVVLQIQDGTFNEHIENVKSILKRTKIFLGVVNLGEYYRFLKNQAKNELRDELSDEPQRTKPKVSKKMSSLPKVPRKKIEEALTELQLFTSCSHRILNTNADLENLILQFSKSIAQIPYKLEKRNIDEQSDWFASGENRDTVKIDKNGNGLKRLWSKTLTTFPLASLETSDAISSKYPTPASLMKTYECRSQIEGEQLLQDIQIRRAAGPLTASRRIGPELSKKIYHFFNSLDGNQIL